MPFYSLRDARGVELATVMAPDADAAAASPRARSLATFHEAVVAGSSRPATDLSVRNAVVDVAEQRLFEAFGRLGLSPREAARAVVGRDGSALERVPLAERAAADGLRAQVTAAASGGRPRGAWRDAKRRLVDARMADALIAVGYSRQEAAAIGGLLLPTPAAMLAPASSGPVPAAESGRAGGSDGESVPLVEVEARLAATLQRGFGLTDAEARHAGRGR